MSLPASVTSLARKKAALVRHLGEDHPETLAVASELRIARLLHEIETGLSDHERAALAALLTA